MGSLRRHGLLVASATRHGGHKSTKPSWSQVATLPIVGNGSTIGLPLWQNLWEHVTALDDDSELVIIVPEQGKHAGEVVRVHAPGCEGGP